MKESGFTIFYLIGAAVIGLFLRAFLISVFGAIGAGAVWLVTLGRVRIGPLSQSESLFAMWIGLIITVFTAGAIAEFFDPK
jgi:hypothetical protein